MKNLHLLALAILLTPLAANSEIACIVSNSITPICGQRINTPEDLIAESALRVDTSTAKASLEICSSSDYPNCPAGTVSEFSVKAAVKTYDTIAKGASEYHSCMDAGGYHGDCAHHLK